MTGDKAVLGKARHVFRGEDLDQMVEDIAELSAEVHRADLRKHGLPISANTTAVLERDREIARAAIEHLATIVDKRLESSFNSHQEMARTQIEEWQEHYERRDRLMQLRLGLLFELTRTKRKTVATDDVREILRMGLSELEERAQEVRRSA